MHGKIVTSDLVKLKHRGKEGSGQKNTLKMMIHL